MPSPVYLYTGLQSAGFKEAVSQFLTDERAAVDEDIEFLSTIGPFKNQEINMLSPALTPQNARNFCQNCRLRDGFANRPGCVEKNL